MLPLFQGATFILTGSFVFGAIQRTWSFNNPRNVRIESVRVKEASGICGFASVFGIACYCFGLWTLCMISISFTPLLVLSQVSISASTERYLFSSFKARWELFRTGGFSPAQFLMSLQQFSVYPQMNWVIVATVTCRGGEARSNCWIESILNGLELLLFHFVSPKYKLIKKSLELWVWLITISLAVNLV